MNQTLVCDTLCNEAQGIQTDSDIQLKQHGEFLHFYKKKLNLNQEQPHQNNICPECMAWMDSVYRNGVEWLKCRGCSYMTKVNKRVRKPV